MVNRGVSRACLTCKARRIRCDEGKPTCKNCTRSQRTCLGYNGMPSEQARPNHVVPGSVRCAWPSPQSSMAPLSPISLLETNANNKKVREAFAKFFSDFVLVSTDPSVSRGYFDGLEHLLAQAGPESALWQATRLVAMANVSNESRIQDFSQRDKSQYADTLLLFQTALKDPEKRESDEAIMTASILGLYEMMVADETYSDALSAHSKGVSSLLFSRNLESDLLPGKRLFWWLNILPRSILEETSMFQASTMYQFPGSKLPTYSLDVLIVRLRSTLLGAYAILSDPKASKVQLRRLKKRANLLNKEFSLWPLCQSSEWMPQTVGTIEQNMGSTVASLDNTPFWPGKVDSYFDLYVAAIWDAYRKCRLKLLQIVINCATRLDESTLAHQKLEGEIHELVNDICASVPFQLAASLNGLSIDNAISYLNKPGKPLGGLLLMYPLYIASTLSIVPPDQRAWMKGRLRWIGKHMGIRQATMLGNTDSTPHLAIADGHALVLSGSLVSPPE